MWVRGWIEFTGLQSQKWNCLTKEVFQDENSVNSWVNVIKCQIGYPRKLGFNVQELMVPQMLLENCWYWWWNLQGVQELSGTWVLQLFGILVFISLYGNAVQQCGGVEKKCSDQERQRWWWENGNSIHNISNSMRWMGFVWLKGKFAAANVIIYFEESQLN